MPAHSKRAVGCAKVRTAVRIPAADPPFCGDSSPLTQPPCRHCAVAPSHRRGLCRECYGKRSVRRKYKPLPPNGNHGWTIPPTRLPIAPTRLPPGKQRVGVLVERAAARVSLFHPDDLALPVPDEAVREFIWARITFGRIKGVYQSAPGRWRAYPFCLAVGRHVHLGYFENRPDACREVILWQADGSPPNWRARRKAERWVEHAGRVLGTD